MDRCMSKNIYDESNELHAKYVGKISIQSKVPLETVKDMSLAYTPGVAEPCREIYKNPSDVYRYTSKGNLVAIVTDGSAVLGLGNIGPEAALPVMEGKAILFKRFANIDAFPICINSQDVDTIVETVVNISPSFGGINLEDISAPRCFEIEMRLKERLNIPVFHDDQHGTAIVVMAALINSLKIVNKTLSTISVVINGAGAAGTAIVHLLRSFGVENIVLCDSKGIIYKGRPIGMSPSKDAIATLTNLEGKQGSLANAFVGSDVFIGVSVPNVVTQDMIRSMAKDPIIFALANPVPEIMPDEAKAAGAKIVCTGRSDFPNQVNNVLVFPGIFRGALDARTSEINEVMKMQAANALAKLVPDSECRPDYVIPDIFNKDIASTIAESVKKVAIPVANH